MGRILIEPGPTGHLPAKESVWAILDEITRCQGMLSTNPENIQVAQDTYGSPGELLQAFEEAIKRTNASTIESNDWNIRVHQPASRGDPSWDTLQKTHVKVIKTYGMKLPWIGVQLTLDEFCGSGVTVALTDKIVSGFRSLSIHQADPSSLDGHEPTPQSQTDILDVASHIQRRACAVVSRYTLAPGPNGDAIDPEIMADIRQDLANLSVSLQSDGLPPFTIDVYDASSSRHLPLGNLGQLELSLYVEPEVDHASTDSSLGGPTSARLLE